MNQRIKLLFVCTYNKMRSKTGEALYYNDPRFEVKSAGIDDDAEVRLSWDLLDWADCTVVMEDIHINWIRINCPEYNVPPPAIPCGTIRSGHYPEH